MLPVEAQATARAPIRFACVTPTVMPRSLNDPVGLCPSCFSSSSSTPANASSVLRVINGVLPSGWVTATCAAVGNTTSANRQTPDAVRLGRAQHAASKRARIARASPLGGVCTIASNPPQAAHCGAASRSSYSAAHASQRCQLCRTSLTAPSLPESPPRRRVRSSASRLPHRHVAWRRGHGHQWCRPRPARRPLGRRR